jgi:hypothetical protein
VIQPDHQAGEEQAIGEAVRMELPGTRPIAAISLAPGANGFRQTQFLSNRCKFLFNCASTASRGIFQISLRTEHTPHASHGRRDSTIGCERPSVSEARGLKTCSLPIRGLSHLQLDRPDAEPAAKAKAA